jgi:hypothetical protein
MEQKYEDLINKFNISSVCTSSNNTFHKVIIIIKGKVRRTKDPEDPEGTRSIALHIRDLGARRGGWSAPRPGRFTPEKDPVSIVKDAGWDPGPFWTCAKNLTPPGFDS